MMLHNKYCWFLKRFKKKKDLLKFPLLGSLTATEDHLHLNKSQSPVPRDLPCQVWFNLARQFWRRRLKCKKLTDE
jgi:hypothetical protein